jgi:hypothetical protein
LNVSPVAGGIWSLLQFGQRTVRADVASPPARPSDTDADGAALVALPALVFLTAGRDILDCIAGGALHREHSGPNDVLVGHVACLGHGGGGHTLWHCRTCEAITYGPALAKHCTALEGPAAMRGRGFGVEDYSVPEPEPPPF